MPVWNPRWSLNIPSGLLGACLDHQMASQHPIRSARCLSGSPDGLSTSHQVCYCLSGSNQFIPKLKPASLSQGQQTDLKRYNYLILLHEIFSLKWYHVHVHVHVHDPVHLDTLICTVGVPVEVYSFSFCWTARIPEQQQYNLFLRF